MKKKNVVFDMDGTLLDTLEDLLSSANYTMRALGYPERELREIRNFAGSGIRRLVELCMPDGARLEEIDPAVDIFMARYSEHCMDQTAPYEGVVELIARLRSKGIKLAIVSNKSNEEVQVMTRRYFGDSISAAIGEMPGVRRKPAPDSVIKAVELLGGSMSESIFVGDSEADFMTAKNAGIDYVMVTWGFRTEEFLRGLGAERFIDRPEQIFDYM